MSDYESESAVAADYATRASVPTVLEEGKVYAFNTADGIEVVDRDLDQYRDNPRRTIATAIVHDPDAFQTYWQEHAHEGSMLFADLNNAAITAYLNASTRDTPGWSDHTLQLKCTMTDDWRDWNAHSCKGLIDQSTFSEFIEDHTAAFINPDGATMLELAQSFQAKSNVAYESGSRLSTGEQNFTYRETTEARAGKKGQISIPSDVELRLQPFEGSDVYKLNARLRYRLRDEQLRLFIKLDRPQDVARSAFNDIIAKVETSTERSVLRGNLFPNIIRSR